MSVHLPYKAKGAPLPQYSINEVKKNEGICTELKLRMGFAIQDPFAIGKDFYQYIYIKKKKLFFKDDIMIKVHEHLKENIGIIIYNQENDVDYFVEQMSALGIILSPNRFFAFTLQN